MVRAQLGTWVGCFALLVPVACGGETVEVGGAGLVGSSSDPAVVAVIYEHADYLVNGGDRIFWFGGYGQGASGGVRSCRKEDCRRSLVTYVSDTFAAASDGGMRSLAVSEGEVYFKPPREEGAFDRTGEVVACHVEGCDVTRRVVAEKVDQYAIDGDWLYWVSNDRAPSGIYRVPRSGEGVEPELVLPLSARIEQLAVRNGHFVWRTEAHELQYWSPESALGIETIATSVSSKFPVTDDAVYWATRRIVADIQRWSFSSSSREAETLENPARVPFSLFAADGFLYMNVELPDSTVGLVRRPLVGSAELQLLGLNLARGFSTITTDERFVYAASNDGLSAPESDLPRDQLFDDGRYVVTIRRYPK